MRTLTVFSSLLLVSAALYGQQPAAAIPNNWAPLATAHMYASGSVPGTDTALDLYLGYQARASNATLFADVVWTPNMTGQSLLYTSNSPAFCAFTALLTDGFDEPVGWGTHLRPAGGGWASYYPEHLFLTTHPADWNGADLQGYPITGLEFQMNQLSLVPSGGSTAFAWDATLTFYTVPEPSLLSLLLLGGLGVGWGQRRKGRGGVV